MAYYMGIDVGTSSLKTLLTDETGQVAGSRGQNYQFSSPRSGWAEQDPAEWWDAAVKTIRQVLAQTGIDSAEIAGIGFSGQMHGLVLLDKNGDPVRPAILHCDARTAPQLQEITEALGPRGVREELMNPVFTGFLLPSLLWVRENEPRSYERIAKVCLPKDYLKFRLCGEVSSDYSDAGATLAYDLKHACWNQRVLAAFHLPAEWFPACFGSCEAVGAVSAEAAAQTGLRAGTKIVAGGGDQAMQRLGSGAASPAEATVNIGTSGQVCFQSAKPLLNPALNTNLFYAHDQRTWLVYGAIMNAGLCLKWWRGVLQDQSYGALDERVAAVPAGSGGLIFLPYLNGERTPHLNPNLSGAFFGLNLGSDRARMSRAVMEGVAYGLYQCLELCEGLGLHSDVLIASGGGARSGVWRQIQSDVFGLPLKMARQEEQACLGACICAAVGCGAYPDAARACAAMVRYYDWLVEPSAENHRLYAQYYQLFKQTYASCAGVLEQATKLGRTQTD